LRKQQTVVDTHARLGSAGFVLAAVLVSVGSLLLPRADNLSDIQAMQQAFAEQATLLQFCALLLTFGFWCALAGTASVQRTITGDGDAWARLGVIFHVVGVAVWTVGMSLDISYPAAIINNLNASPERLAETRSIVAVLSPEGFGRGLFPLNMLINWLSFALLSLGMLLSTLYPRWLSGWGLIIGVAGCVLGIAMTFTGREALLNFFLIVMFPTLLWWLVLGGWIARRAWR